MLRSSVRFFMDDFNSISRISEQHQQLLATTLALDYESLSAEPQWPTILGRTIAAWAIPVDTPTKRKDKKQRASSRAEEKQGAHSSVDLDDDDVDEVLSPEEDPLSARHIHT